MFRNTAWFEKSLLNVYQFSAAKDYSETLALQTLALDSKNFQNFLKEAEQVVELSRQTWMRVEYDSAIRGAVMGESWRKLEESKEVYPYWQYHGVMDDREREEHVALEGLVFRIGDPEGDAIYPPEDFNCLAYNTLISTDQGGRPIYKINTGDQVLTRNGLNKVIKAWSNGEQNIWQVKFDSEEYNHTFYATLNHKVYTKEFGFIELGKLTSEEFYTFYQPDNFESRMKITLTNLNYEIEVWDLMVENEPEFFANGILVHNCRCSADPVDDEDLKDQGKSVSKGSDYLEKDDPETGKPYVDENFRFNPGKEGPLPSQSSYFDILGSANKSNAELFDIE